jgi:inorganic pyrophosphatase
MPRSNHQHGRTKPKLAAKRELQIIVETPAGSRNKYAFDPKTSRIKLSKVLPEGMIFPYDFGFLPGTQAEDGDPLDVLVLTDEPTFPGCQLDVRVLGVIKATQQEEGEEHRNDRIIAVAQQSVRYADVKELKDLDPALLKQIEAFFINYQKVRNVEFRIEGRAGAESALKSIADAA